MTVTAITMGWNTGSTYYSRFDYWLPAKNFMSVPVALSIRALGTENALADIEIRIMDSNNNVVGTRTATDITFRHSEDKTPVYFVDVPGGLTRGQSFTIMARAFNGRPWTQPSGTLTSATITRGFTTPAAPSPDPNPDPDPNPTPSPSGVPAWAIAGIIAGLAFVGGAFKLK